jgi:hypothetical protein
VKIFKNELDTRNILGGSITQKLENKRITTINLTIGSQFGTYNTIIWVTQFGLGILFLASLLINYYRKDRNSLIFAHQ